MKSVWLNEQALSVIDSAFWIAERESYIGDSDLPAWNQIRKAMGEPLIVHDPEHGFLQEDDPRVGTPFPRSSNVYPKLDGVTTTTASIAEDFSSGARIPGINY